MNVAAYVEALQQDLANVAGIGDEAVAEAARRIAAALESSLRLRLMDALGEAAAELTNQLPDGHVEVRVTGGEPELVYVPEPGAPPPSGLEDLSARITLRLPETLKAIVDAAAADVVEQVRAALGESADVVFDCVAVQSTVTQAVGMALKGGTVVVVGVPSRDVTMPLVVMQDQQVRVQGSATYTPEDFATSIELLRSGAVVAEDVVTGQFPLDRAAEAFEASTGGDHIKVLVRI